MQREKNGNDNNSFTAEDAEERRGSCTYGVTKGRNVKQPMTSVLCVPLRPPRSTLQDCSRHAAVVPKALGRQTLFASDWESQHGFPTAQRSVPATFVHYFVCNQATRFAMLTLRQSGLRGRSGCETNYRSKAWYRPADCNQVLCPELPARPCDR